MNTWRTSRKADNIKRQRYYFNQVEHRTASKKFLSFVKSQMNSYIPNIVALICIVLLISSCCGTNTFASNNDRFDASDHQSNYANVTFEFVKRNVPKKCVLCKFSFFPCCEPNICVKKTFRPDKCLQVKQGK